MNEGGAVNEEKKMEVKVSLDLPEVRNALDTARA